MLTQMPVSLVRHVCCAMQQEKVVSQQQISMSSQNHYGVEKHLFLHFYFQDLILSVMLKWKLELLHTTSVPFTFLLFSVVCWLACREDFHQAELKCELGGSPECGMLPALFSEIGEICIPPLLNFMRGRCCSSSGLLLSTLWDCTHCFSSSCRTHSISSGCGYALLKCV